MRRALLVIMVGLLVPGLAAAQDEEGSWESQSQLRAGQEIEVYLALPRGSRLSEADVGSVPPEEKVAVLDRSKCDCILKIDGVEVLGRIRGKKIELKAGVHTIVYGGTFGASIMLPKTRVQRTATIEMKPGHVYAVYHNRLRWTQPIQDLVWMDDKTTGELIHGERLAPGSESAYARSDKALASYGALEVENFTVDKNVLTKHFPGGYDVVLQKSAVAKLRKNKFFDQVTDAAEPSAPEGEAAAMATTGKRRLVLSGTILVYDKGRHAGRAVRILGAIMGGIVGVIAFGKADTVWVRFAFRDVETGEDVLLAVRQGELTDVIDDLVKIVEKNR